MRVAKPVPKLVCSPVWPRRALCVGVYQQANGFGLHLPKHRVWALIYGAIGAILETLNGGDPASTSRRVGNDRLRLLQHVGCDTLATCSRHEPDVRKTEVSETDKFVSRRVVLRDEQFVIEGLVQPLADLAKAALAEIHNPAASIQLLSGERELETQGVAVEQIAVAFRGPLSKCARQAALSSIGLR